MEACKCAQSGIISPNADSSGKIQAGFNLTLAMATVPLQPWEELYPPAKALARGTVFPGLDLPFFAGGEHHV
ncbi:MAG: spore coat associated protein CotJA [Lachnospiraceae bacterium]|nr:spore coat associated protein CotJA [Lachnospiraceae bacterium]